MAVIGVWSRTHGSPSSDIVRAAPWRERAGIALTDDLAQSDVLIAVLEHENDLHEATRVAAGRPLLVTGSGLTGPDAAAVAVVTGLDLGKVTAVHDVRVRRTSVLDPRGEGDLEVEASFPPVEKFADDVEVLATANLAFTDHPVLTWRPSTGAGALTLGASPTVWNDADLVRTIQRWSRHVRGIAERPEIRIGLLAYGAIGHEHLSAVQAVPGLSLAAVCDRSTARLEAARVHAPDVHLTTDGAELLARDDVDLVIVSTPPDTHAAWALRALEAGKHVVLEKPMALTRTDCDAVQDAARTAGRLAVVYQNRRWDSDFLTLKRAIDDGRIGEVFHTEAFVGGYGHPCNYWHSDAAVSGGAIFDWGSHFIDQILDLTTASVTSVSARNHKRRWHDVTNADHSRVTLTFDDGSEAEFIHSDLAAVLKPKYYVLGTRGAVVGEWRHERLLSRTGIGTMAEEAFAPADAPADLTLVDEFGSATRLAHVQPRPHAFHRELADHLMAGLPMTLDPERSRDVVAVMEAAEESAASGGRPVPMTDLRSMGSRG
jgi:predicted dehydrogenase